MANCIDKRLAVHAEKNCSFRVARACYVHGSYAWNTIFYQVFFRVTLFRFGTRRDAFHETVVCQIKLSWKRRVYNL